MKYDNGWMTAVLEDIRQFCRANAMPETARKVAEAVRCAELEELRIRSLDVQVFSFESRE